MCSKEKNQVSFKDLSKWVGRSLASLLKNLQHETAQGVCVWWRENLTVSFHQKITFTIYTYCYENTELKLLKYKQISTGCFFFFYELRNLNLNQTDFQIKMNYKHVRNEPLHFLNH